MDKLLPLLLATGQRVIAWSREHLLPLLITCFVVSAVAILVFRLVSHQAVKILRNNPTLSKSELRKDTKASKLDQQKAAATKASADSLLATTTTTEKQISARLITIQKLKAHYHAITPDTAASPAVQSFLSHYSPGADSL